jgi:7-carboxy-7-deazaguanine synthase
MSTLPVNEIFYSIQGESTLAGVPTVFIRLAGCNLKCAWCDTAYALDPASGKDMELEDICKEAFKYECRYICITGGEPLMYKKTEDLMQEMNRRWDRGFGPLVISIETNGGVPIYKMQFKGVTIKTIMDIKCPSSQVPPKYYKVMESNLGELEPIDEIKFVVTRSDLDFVAHVLPKCPDVEVLISPVWDHIDLKELAEWIKSNRFLHPYDRVRLQLQMHKIIWHPQERGV